LAAKVSDVAWGPGETLLAASMLENVSMLCETVMHHKMNGKTSVMQLSSDRVSVETFKETPYVIQAGIPIKGLDLFGENLVVFSGKKIEIYEVKDGNALILYENLYSSE
jgi:hypothetical protein